MTAPHENESNGDVYVGFSSWNGTGDTWSFVSVSAGGLVSSIIDVYTASEGDSGSNLFVTGDIVFDGSTGSLAALYAQLTSGSEAGVTSLSQAQAIDGVLLDSIKSLVALSSGSSGASIQLGTEGASVLSSVASTVASNALSFGGSFASNASVESTQEMGLPFAAQLIDYASADSASNGEIHERYLFVSVSAQL